jgi:hypothetical protein
VSEKIYNRTVVPAPPGWYVAVLVVGGTDGKETWPDRLDLDPIIAWEIERTEQDYHPSANRPPGIRAVHHSVIPLTLEGNHETRSDWCVKTPDGKFEFVHVASFDKEEDVIKELKTNRG